MKVYEGANVRNVAVVGHGHAGKTQLISAMLYTAGAERAAIEASRQARKEREEAHFDEHDGCPRRIRE